MKLVWQIWKYALMWALEYRISFLSQNVFMILNNSLIILVFFLFFQKFDTIWWLQFFEWALLFSIFWFFFSYLHIFMSWYKNLAYMIKQGKLDGYLLLPPHPLVSIIPSKIDSSAIWDFITSMGIFILVYIFSNLGVTEVIILMFKVMFLSLFSAFIILWFLIFFHSLTFFIWSSEQLSRWAGDSIMWPSMYPPEIYQWTWLKPIFMSVIPVFYTTFLPFALVQNFSLSGFAVLIIACIVFLSIGVFTFNKGLKKYESWNMVITNV